MQHVSSVALRGSRVRKASVKAPVYISGKQSVKTAVKTAVNTAVKTAVKTVVKTAVKTEVNKTQTLR